MTTAFFKPWPIDIAIAWIGKYNFRCSDLLVPAVVEELRTLVGIPYVSTKLDGAEVVWKAATGNSCVVHLKTDEIRYAIINR